MISAILSLILYFTSAVMPG